MASKIRAARASSKHQPSFSASFAVVLGGGRQHSDTAVHLMRQREQLWTSGFHTPPAQEQSQGSGEEWEAWTDVGDVGVYPRAI